ncbi:MAG: hypothetical protein JNL01_03840 [Bdellovibrionales bacterium]|nr:hypothetical protein [Bdellovibrionales bacterium]
MKPLLSLSLISLCAFASPVAYADGCSAFTQATAKKLHRQVSQVIGQENGLVLFCADCVDQEIRSMPVETATFRKDPKEKGEKFNVLINGEKISFADIFIKKNPRQPFDDQLVSVAHELGCAKLPKEKEISLMDKQNFHTAFRSVFPTAEVFLAFKKCQKDLLKQEIDLAYEGIQKAGFQFDGVSEKWDEPRAYLGAGAGEAFYRMPHSLETTLSLKNGNGGGAKVNSKLVIFAQSTTSTSVVPAIPPQPAQYDALGNLQKHATEEVPAREIRKVKLTVHGGWEDSELSMVRSFRFNNQETGQPVLTLNSGNEQVLDIYQTLQKAPPSCEVEIELKNE